MLKNILLAPLTTFQIGGRAEYFVVVQNKDELKEAVRFAKEKKLAITILGGGSNVLIADEGIHGLVIKNEIGGIEYKEDGENVFVRAGAGVEWDALVAETVSKGYWGLENLSLIPGTVGATPIQNMGAYGVEVADVIVSVGAFDVPTLEQRVFTNAECEFGYRDSKFKHTEGQRFIVTDVTYKLSKSPKPILHYKDLESRFNGEMPSIQAIREAVIEIRSAKFPDTKSIGTAGSFFKNPIITAEAFKILREKYTEIPGFPEGNESVKVPLGWVLDRALGIKGVREGNVGTYEAQALVLVNLGGATAKEVDAFAKKIEEKVFDATQIKIEREVNFVS